MWPGFVEPSIGSGVLPGIFDRYEGQRLPVSIRNNNMGAISITGEITSSFAARQPGFVGTTPRPASEGGYYAVYATPEHGVHAASTLLQSYGNRGYDTPMEIVSRWSADTSAHPGYADTLVRYLRGAGFNVGRNSTVNLDDPAVRTAILKGKSHYESGAGGPVYSDDIFARGVAGNFSGNADAAGGGFDQIVYDSSGRIIGGFDAPSGGPLRIGVEGAGPLAPNNPQPTAPAGYGSTQTVEVVPGEGPGTGDGDCGWYDISCHLMKTLDYLWQQLTEPLYRILFVLLGLILLGAALALISRAPQNAGAS